MGSKGLKAVLVKRFERASSRDANEQARQTVVAFNRFVAGNERVKELREYGTASTVMLVQKYRGLPTHNFSKGEFISAESIGGDAVRATILARGGKGTPTETCMDGCVIQCSNIFPDSAGEISVAPLEFETLGLCGSNIGLSSLDDIANINRLCNKLGLDTIEVGAALGVMMEAAENNSTPGQYQGQLPRFGDGKRCLEIIESILEGSPLGLLAGNGVVAAGQALGVKHIPAVKGQAISAYDPRVIKGTGVTYATSPQGADHTAGLTVFIPVDPRDSEKAPGLSRNVQIQRASYDALGLCAFNLGATGQRADLVLQMLRARYGIELPDTWLDELGRKVIRTELLFNKAAGMTSANDRLPEYFSQEPLDPSGDLFDVSAEELSHFWDNL
jgi:aldehyde:ferredoxin oxidoreductase